MLRCAYSAYAVASVPRRWAIAAVVGSLLVAAIVATPASSAPSCASFDTVRVRGTVADESLNEISGIVFGRAAANILWAIEDSGNPASVYALSRSGERLATVEVTGATNADWEDIARAQGRIWIGDIGNNTRSRNQVTVYWFDQPDTTSITSVAASSVRLRYPDGNHDAEALLVDGDLGFLYIFEKQRDREDSRVYRAELDAISDGGEVTLEAVGTVAVRSITAADIGPTGIVLSNYGGAYFFETSRSGRVSATLSATPCLVHLRGSESVAFSIDGRRMYSIPEGATPDIEMAAPR